MRANILRIENRDTHSGRFHLHSTFSLGEFCACELGEGEQFADCSLCADGTVPDTDPFVNKAFPDVNLGDAITCGSAETEFRTFPPVVAPTPAECNKLRECKSHLSVMIRA